MSKRAPVQLPTAAQMKKIILKALKESKLQCQKKSFKPGIDQCRYTSPCVVGVCMDPKDRRYLERKFNFSEDIGSLITSGLVVLSKREKDPTAVADWLARLQANHDDADIETLTARAKQGPTPVHA